jgi:two-component system cell cycle response regulator
MAALSPYVLLVEASVGQAPALPWHRVEVAPDVAAARALTARRRPDAIVAGVREFDELRSEDGLGAVPFVVVATDRGALLSALARGAHDGVLSPFDPTELEARVVAALRVTARHDELIEANRRLAEQAMTDELTGLANRRHGERQLEREIALAVRKGHDLGLVRVDIDHFKTINDEHGHQAGDRVLAEVARRLGGAVRGGDLLARWGGDEFVAILPATDRAGVLRAAERLRAAVDDSAVGVEDVATPVTVSVGWAHWMGDTAGDLLARADRALYMAKDAGRNRVFPLRPSGPLA